ncbi:hypothetical protein VTI28DRAFT_2323 [Corynascus sepedonium]
MRATCSRRHPVPPNDGLSFVTHASTGIVALPGHCLDTLSAVPAAPLTPNKEGYLTRFQLREENRGKGSTEVAAAW